MKMTRTLFLIFFLLFGSYSAFGKQVLKHSLGVFISERGQQILNKNVPSILFNNGVSVDEYYIKNHSVAVGEKPLEELSDDPEVTDLLIKSRDYLQRFLMGFEFNDPNFQIDLKDIEVVADWSHFQALASKAEATEKHPEGGVVFQLDIEAKNIRFDLGQLRLNDLNNEFLGEFSMDKLWLTMTEESTPLKISFPIYVYNTSNGKYEFEIKNPYTNLDQLELNADFNSPLGLPQIEVNINGRTFGIDRDEIEKSLRDSREVLIKSIQGSGQAYVDEKLAETLTKFLNEKYYISGLETNEMAPPGADGEENPKPLKWGLEIGKMNFVKDHLFLGLNGFVEDPVKPNAPNLSFNQNSQKLPKFENQNYGEYDVALSINRGFFNRIVQLSYNRGYFNTVDVEGEKEPIKLSQKPTIKIFEERGKAQAKLDLQIEYTVTGLSSVFVKNPIRIDFDLDLAFKELDNGKVQIVVAGIDMDSVNVDSKYIRMFKKKVRKAVRDKFKAIDLKGMELVDELPIPESIVGVPLKVVGSHWDKNGYIMMLLDIGFDR